jgi:dienelactone hydrolase
MIPPRVEPTFTDLAAEDQWLSPARRDQAEARLKGNTMIDSKLVLYPGKAGVNAE